MSYYIFFPVRNGVDTIKQVMESLVTQIPKPEKIIVVNDGSTDGTSEILNEFAKLYPFVKIIRLDSKTKDFSRIPYMWNICLDKNFDYQMIAAGDCIFPPDYADKIMTYMKQNPKVVICSGDFTVTPSQSPHGAGRFIDQGFFFRHYTEYPKVVGYESEILIRAMMAGNEIKILNDVKFTHADRLGHSHDFSEFGQAMRTMGYHPLFVLLRFASDFFTNHEMGKHGAIKMLISYIRFKPKDTGYFSNFPEDIKQYLRKEQLRRVRSVALTPKRILVNKVMNTRRILRNKAMRIKHKIKSKEIA